MMYKISEVIIDGFWGGFKASTKFGDDVNIIIGKNGTGKSTFMNILSGVLGVDPIVLDENDFSEVIVRLKYKGKIKTIKIRKVVENGFVHIYYGISRVVHVFPLASGEDTRYGLMARRRAIEAVSQIQKEISKFLSVASLSVYRFRIGSDSDMQDRNRRTIGPVDLHLERLMQGLTGYQLELSQEARKISLSLQREVLTSLLYRPGDSNKTHYASDFDEEKEKRDLISAYRNLGIFDAELSKRIQEHLQYVKTAVDGINAASPDWASIDIEALEAAQRAHSVFSMSLKAEQKTKDLNSHADSFLALLAEFIEGKDFAIDNSGVLAIYKKGIVKVGVDQRIPVEKLSSGEKQLIILLVEALLQRQRPYVFLADEPELSLHIAWQRKIIPAIRLLNPNAQIIVATHSPEVAGKFRSDVIDMVDVLHESL